MDKELSKGNIQFFNWEQEQLIREFYLLADDLEDLKNILKLCINFFRPENRKWDK